MFFIELIEKYQHDNVAKSAAALTYYMIFALFPFLLFVSTLLGFLNIPLVSLSGHLSQFLPEDMIMLLNVCIVQVTENRSSTVLAFSFIFALWFPLRAINAIMDAINIAYRGKPRKSPLKQKLFTFVYMIVVMLFIIVALFIVVIGENVLQWAGNYLPFSIPIQLITLWSKLRFLPLTIILFCVLSSLYYASPNERPKRKYVFSGAFMALISWLVFSIAFAYYVDNMANYSVVYGSIGAIIVLLMWFYFSAIVILMGAEWNDALLSVYGK
nr:YihY/virulence factor BrkB family protein [Clostridium sp. MD294]